MFHPAEDTVAREGGITYHTRCNNTDGNNTDIWGRREVLSSSRRGVHAEGVVAPTHLGGISLAVEGTGVLRSLAVHVVAGVTAPALQRIDEYTDQTTNGDVRRGGGCQLAEPLRQTHK